MTRQFLATKGTAVSPSPLINIERTFKGMPAILMEEGKEVGHITDVVVHPIEGFVMGFVLITNDGKEQVLVANDCSINLTLGALMVMPGAWDDQQQIRTTLARGVRACESLLGIEVVTRNGKSLGRVIEVYATESELRTIYRVASYRLRFLVRGGTYLPGDLPIAWLERGARLIVPADTMERESFSTIDEVLKFV